VRTRCIGFRERRRRVLGPDHDETLISMGNLGEVILDRGRVVEAAQILRVASEKGRATLPKTDFTLPNLLAKWGRCQMLMGRNEVSNTFCSVRCEQSQSQRTWSARCRLGKPFLAVFAQEKLLDLKPSSCPPCDADKERIGAAPAR
jgi:hypothetical protein